MSDITVTYKGSTIATMDATGSKTLTTAGKYCEDDISIAYTKPSGSYIGGTVVWNQIARYLNRRGNRPCFGTTNAQVVSETNRSMTVTGVQNATYWNDLPSGHRILATAIMTVDGTPINNMQVNFGGNIVSTGVKLTNGVPTQIAVIGTQKGTGGGSSYNDFYFYPNGTGGAALNSFTITDFQLFDLTQMFGSTIADYIYTLEQGTKGAGVAWLNTNGFFSKPYYPYAAASLQSVELFVPPIKDSNGKIIGYFPQNFNFELRGILKLNSNNNLYYDGDEYDGNGTVTRKCGFRAYESGDETDGSTMITDGSNTVYLLSIPTTESV